MSSRRLCGVAFGFCVWLVVPTCCLAQASNTVTMTIWNVRFTYANGRSDVGVQDYETEAAAIEGAAKAKRDWNLAFPGDMTKAVPFPVQVRYTPPSPNLRQQEETPLQLPSRQGRDNASLPAVPQAPPPTQFGGKNWVGTETLGGYGRLEFRFLPNNKVEMIDVRQRVTGSWYQSGNQVSLLFWDGQCVYHGSVNGSSLSGKASNGKQQWTWQVSR